MSENTTVYTYKDFASDQEVRWCPGCDDYVILRAVEKALPQIGKKKEDIAFISGIGCSSRFPYYVDTYGMHSIHGRAPAIASGTKLANPDLSVWVITGDGDSLAIGGNHFIHVLRRNIDLNIILFNNEIYGLTKGQFSPTTELGLKTKSSPYGNTQAPFHVGSLALGANASFFARVPGNNPKAMTEVFVEAEKHKGTSLIEVLQNCVIFNDGVFDDITDKKVRAESQVWVKHGEPMIFGAENDKGLVLKDGHIEVAKLGENGVTEADIMVHDAHKEDPVLHFMLSRLRHPMVMGVIRSVRRSTYGENFSNQVKQVQEKAKYHDVQTLLNSGDTYTISDN